MKGTVFKRCTKCDARVDGQACGSCGSSSYTWHYRVYVGKGPDGRWKERWRGGFETKRAADRALTEFLSSLHAGSHVPKSTMTLGEYLQDEWLPATAPPQVKPETWQDRARNLDHHVVQRIGGVRLQDLNAAHLNRLYSTLLSEGRVRGEGGLSPTTVRRIHSMLRTALNDAVRWGLLETNPVLASDPPPARVVKASRRRSMTVWTASQLKYFLSSNQDHLHHPLWVFAASTGARRSEVLGLQWSDIDFDAATAHIHQTVVMREDGDYAPVEDQKSGTAARTIHLDERTIETLQDHQIAQESRRQAAGTRWEDHDLVFTLDDGHWRHPHAVTQAFRRTVRTTDVPYIRFHDLRHTHATLLLRAGINPKVVSERLGHSSVAFTLDTYAHVIPGMQSAAAEQFRKLVYEDEAPQDDAAVSDDDTAGAPDADPSEPEENE